MSDSSDPDSTPIWIDVGSTEELPRDSPTIKVTPDADSETVTFAWRLNGERLDDRLDQFASLLVGF